MTRPLKDPATNPAAGDRQADPLVREASSEMRDVTCAIAVMSKASTPGLVKTRLVPPLSNGQAADLNSAFLADVLDNLALAGRQAAVARYLSFGPPGSADFFESRFSADIGLMEAWSPDFGDCLFRTVDRLFALGYGSACVLNSDSPNLPTARLIETARLLGEPGDRAVLGPAIDGGYYLLGLKAPHRRMFEDIDWSTDVVAQQTLERAAEIGLELVTLAPWYDVDDEGMLHRLIEQMSMTHAASDPDASYEAHHTKLALRDLVLPGRTAGVLGPGAREVEAS